MRWIIKEKGDVLSASYADGSRWVTKEASVETQYNLGNQYYSGKGVTQDYKQAVNWYRKAAIQGVAPAQYNLGVMYANGRGVKQDYSEAYILFSMAAISGNKQAVHYRDVSAQKLSTSALEDAQYRMRHNAYLYSK